MSNLSTKVRMGAAGLADEGDGGGVPVDVVLRHLRQAAASSTMEATWPFAVLLETQIPFDLLVSAARTEHDALERVLDKWVEHLESMLLAGGPQGADLRAFRRAHGIASAAAEELGGPKE